MEWIETTGRSLEEAKDTALDQLGVDESEAEFEVLEEPRTGLFGRVRGEARIRARVQPARPRPKIERRDRGRKRATKAPAKGGRGPTRETGSTDTTPADITESDDGVTGGVKKVAANRGRSGSRSPRKKTTSGDQSASVPGTSSTAESSGSARGASRNAVKEPASRPARAPGDDMTDDDVTVEQQAELTSSFLDGLLEAFGAQGSISQERVDDETIEVNVVGDDLGLLIGPKGQTLAAIQDLSRTNMQRRATGRHEGRVRIDVGGYRQHRREALERFARQIAGEVINSGSQRALEPMAASDRKVVHDVLNTVDGVQTLSEGEEPRRRVVIAPV